MYPIAQNRNIEKKLNKVGELATLLIVTNGCPQPIVFEAIFAFTQVFSHKIQGLGDQTFWSLHFQYKERQASVLVIKYLS